MKMLHAMVFGVLVSSMVYGMDFIDKDTLSLEAAAICITNQHGSKTINAAKERNRELLAIKNKKYQEYKNQRKDSINRSKLEEYSNRKIAIDWVKMVDRRAKCLQENAGEMYSKSYREYKSKIKS